MLCYVPNCVSGVPYFPVLTKCGFREEQGGGIVDCIQTINMSGINELLVSQRHSSAGATTTSLDQHHHRPEILHEMEELLEFPSQESRLVELESRFEHLCKVLQIAKDTFSSLSEGDGEEEHKANNNPFQELKVQLQKFKDRFHARVGNADGGNSKTSGHGCRRLFKRPTSASNRGNNTNNHNRVNPFQELRDALRMARRHFVPLIDQYISSKNTHKNNSRKNDGDAILGLSGEARQGIRFHCNDPTTTACEDITHNAAVNAVHCESTIKSMGFLMEMDRCRDFKPSPISVMSNNKELSSQTSETEMGSVEMSCANSAPTCCTTTTVLAVDLTDDCSGSCLPLHLCSCNRMSSGAAATSYVRLVRETVDTPCT
ncbi:unnamed protein product [Calypogeia fissa]